MTCYYYNKETTSFIKGEIIKEKKATYLITPIYNQSLQIEIDKNYVASSLDELKNNIKINKLT